MGTRAHVVVTAEPGLEDQLTGLAVRELSLMERRWSRFLPTSELSRLNAAAGKPVIVSADTFSVIKSAVDAWNQTDGCFDPTVHDALCATGYDRTFAELAEQPDRPGAARPAPGCAEIELDPGLCAVRLPVGVRLDLGGIAKGAAADLVVGRLRANGADGACVNVGGDIRVDGCAPTTAGWIIEVAFAELHRRRITLASGAVCTSTTSKRRWITADGERHHIIDPRGGRSTTGLRWVSVIAARATQAEVLTKAVFVAGADAGRRIIEDNRCYAVIVDDNDAIFEIGCLEELAA
ncbi:MAG: FAD:protein FMN transferase [Acidimicrobiales bacterium]